MRLVLPDRADLLDYRQELDMRHGVLHRTLRYRDERGRVTSVRQRRLVSMADPHVAALETTVTAENWSGPLLVRATLDGRVTNSGVRRYRALRGDHLTGHATGHEDGITWVRARTRTSDIAVTLAARLESEHRHAEAAGARVEREDGRVSEVRVLELTRGVPRAVTKIVALATSRDHARPSARVLARRAPGFGELLERHAAAWERLWRRARLDVDGPEVSQIVRLHVFHLLQTLSPHTADLDVGVPARGLHGEAYRGHVFWDELFVLPWLNLRFPEISRALLRYRWRRLPEARAAAREAGYAGAMFPWQSGGDGREETQTLHLNPVSGRWLPDRSRLQRHVGLAIAHNVWRYHRDTGDAAFLAEIGAELVVEIARFFASLARYDKESGRYEIRGVMGPDEYHDAYPGATSPGLDNNAYTNVMAAWLLARVPELLAAVPGRVRADLEVTAEELARWDEVSRRLRVDFHDGVISQFSGYEKLLELDWERYPGVRRLDRALEAAGDDPNRYRASKQADVLMLFYLLGPEGLAEMLERLGYPPDPELMRRTVSYYLARTAHGSTLSAVVHAWVLARFEPAGSWRFFLEALASDIGDVQEGTTAEGVHLGAMAGTLDLVQRCFLGLRARPGELRLDPALPARLGRVALPIQVGGAWLEVEAEGSRVTVTRDPDGPEHLDVTVRGHRVRVARGTGHIFDLDTEPVRENHMTDDETAGRKDAPALEELEEAECLRLVSGGGIGRVAFGGPSGPVVLPVNYVVRDGAIVFRTRYGGAMDQDLRTGLEGLEFTVGFQVDHFDEVTRGGGACSSRARSTTSPRRSCPRSPAPG
ncbi:pyridoxamine 5'-phosphate oxidase family protein [Thermocatellispora tengchongensis]|uniref:pyridoxamine 5'-phosphate oxidase family protein n=1 Tax=Thermocatellispora tengchongensis TaxID=1073253 RepID=UPI0036425625